jgi:dihydrodipicolinate synthase/N-acetylneuraminate lyase
MSALRATDITGVWSTLLLPLDADDSIDWDQLGDELDLLVRSGVHGIYAHGTAGEFHTLDEAEFDRINELLAGRCEAAGVPFQIGASHPVAQTSLQRVRRARNLSPGAFQIILPDWLPLNDDEVVAFLARIAEAADPVPLVLYNPPHAKTPVSPALLGRLLDAVPSLVGLKTAGGDETWYDAVRAFDGRCSIFVPGHLLATGLARGAHGSYSNVAAMSPTGAVRWYETMRTDPDAAVDTERRLAQFFRRHVAPLQDRRLSNPALDKFLCAVGGWAPVGTRTRWPMTAAPEGAVAAARHDARSLVPELFPPA